MKKKSVLTKKKRKCHHEKFSGKPQKWRKKGNNEDSPIVKL